MRIHQTALIDAAEKNRVAADIDFSRQLHAVYMHVNGLGFVPEVRKRATSTQQREKHAHGPQWKSFSIAAKCGRTRSLEGVQVLRISIITKPMQNNPSCPTVNRTFHSDFLKNVPG